MSKGDLTWEKAIFFPSALFWSLLAPGSGSDLGPHVIIGIQLLLITMKTKSKYPRQRWIYFYLKNMCKFRFCLYWPDPMRNALQYCKQNRLVGFLKHEAMGMHCRVNQEVLLFH